MILDWWWMIVNGCWLWTPQPLPLEGDSRSSMAMRWSRMPWMSEHVHVTRPCHCGKKPGVRPGQLGQYEGCYFGCSLGLGWCDPTPKSFYWKNLQLNRHQKAFIDWSTFGYSRGARKLHMWSIWTPIRGLGRAPIKPATEIRLVRSKFRSDTSCASPCEYGGERPQINGRSICE